MSVDRKMYSKSIKIALKSSGDDVDAVEYGVDVIIRIVSAIFVDSDIFRSTNMHPVNCDKAP